jgi:hypothetical protein
LLEGDVTDEAAETAFFAYLRGLEEIARLEIVSLWTETDTANLSRGRVYVLARTATEPRRHFYRTASSGMWEPWIPVDIEIEGDLVCIANWRGRVHVFWLTFVERGSDPDNGTVESAAKKTPAQLTTRQVDTRLNWCELIDGAWEGPFGTTPAGGGRFKFGAGFDPADTAAYVTKEYDKQGRERAILFNSGGTALRMTTPNAPPRTVRAAPRPGNPYDIQAAIGNGHAGSGDLTATYRSAVSVTPDGAAPPGGGATIRTDTIPILASGGGYRLVTGGDPYALPGSDVGPLVAPFFYQDEDNTFFVEPNLTVTTVETWDNWVPAPVAPEPIWKNPEWWKKLPLEVQTPKLKPRIPIDPGDPAPWFGLGGQPLERAPSVLNPVLSSIGDPGPVKDWLTAPGTLVSFDSRVVGQRGGLDLVQIVTSAAVADGVTDRESRLVAVRPGVAGGLGELVTRVTETDRQVGNVLVGETTGRPTVESDGISAGTILGRVDGRVDESRVGVVVGGGGVRTGTIRQFGRGTTFDRTAISGRFGALGGFR